MSTASHLTFDHLKEKQRRIREGFPPDHGLRVHRALSWLDRAERTGDDDDAAFIFYWIAFNAAYAVELSEIDSLGERTAFDDYFERIVRLDTENRVYDAVWQRFSQSARLFLSNQYVFSPFWKFKNGIPGYEDWEARFERSKRRIGEALAKRETRVILSTLFDRLYVLRNQLIHGGATWKSTVNRDQVKDGKRILSFLVPLFIDIMLDHPNEPWGAPYYPVVD